MGDVYCRLKWCRLTRVDLEKWLLNEFVVYCCMCVFSVVCESLGEMAVKRVCCLLLYVRVQCGL